MNGETSNIETPQALIASSPITLELKRLGVTDDQLAGMRFRNSNTGWPFDQWSFTWLDGTPPVAINHIKSFCALKWLILEDPPCSRDKSDAWGLISATVVAPIYRQGISFKETQRLRAKRPRGKITEDGQTIGQIVQCLALKPEHQDETASQLWPHFFAELDRLGLDPEETGHSDLRKRRYSYDLADKRKHISYGQFANWVSTHRKKKSG